MEDLIKKLCSAPGVSGNEKNIAEVAKQELAKFANTKIDKNNNVISVIGNTESNKHIMLDAHIDQIGFVVTSLLDGGFLKISNCGGIDPKILPGSVLSIHGTRDILGIVTSTPPHLSDDQGKTIKKIDDIFVDTGLSYDDLKNNISVGDLVSFYPNYKRLLNDNISSPSLDNRAGVASIIKCAEILSKESLNCKVSVVLSSQEEVNSKGAKTSSYALNPDEAIVVDVSFASQPSVPDHKTGLLCNGPMIGISPILSKNIYSKLIDISENLSIPYQLEVMGGKTGTNVDKINISKYGIPSGLVSIPLRYMHTPCEVVNLLDLKNTVKLICAYIKNGGVS